MRSRALRQVLRVVIAAAGLAFATACIFNNLSDRFKTCEDVPVDLINDSQTRAAVTIAGPEETFLAENRLESGQSRRIFLCLEKGDAKKFRVEQNGAVIATANCVASLATYEARTVSVVWTPDGFRCDGW